MPGVWAQNEGGEWGAGTRQEFRTCQLLRDFLARPCPTCPVTKPGESYRFLRWHFRVEMDFFFAFVGNFFFSSKAEDSSLMMSLWWFFKPSKKNWCCAKCLFEFFWLDLVRKLPSHAYTLQWLKQKVFFFAFVAFFLFQSSGQFSHIVFIVASMFWIIINQGKK
jgi:hypothetical protein